MDGQNVRRALAVGTVFIGASASTLALVTPVPRNFAYVAGGDRLDVFVGSSALAATLGAVVAVVAASSVRSSKSASAVAGCGVLLLVLGAVGVWPGQLHLRAVAAGLVLGGCAVFTGSRDRRLLQCALVIGAVSGVVAAGPAERIPTRYRDYMVGETPQIYLLVAIGVFVALLIASTWVSAFDVAPECHSKDRLLLVGCMIPVAGLILYWLFARSVDTLGSDGGMQSRWLLGLIVVPLVVAAAFALPAASGSVLLAALAYLAVGTTMVHGWLTAALFIAIMLLGGVVGWRRQSPLIGIGILAVVAATGILAGEFDATEYVADVVALPFAIGLLYTSLLPTQAPIAAISVTTPIAVSVPIVAEFGWTAYTPLTSIEPTLSPTAWEWTSTAVAVASVLAAGVGIWVLRRRPSA